VAFAYSYLKSDRQIKKYWERKQERIVRERNS